MFVGIGSDFFGNSLFIHPNNITLVEAEFSLNIFTKLLPSLLSLLGVVSALILYNKYINYPLSNIQIQIKIIKLHLQNVNIKLQLQTQHGGHPLIGK